jgi:hypothetical protein
VIIGYRIHSCCVFGILVLMYTNHLILLVGSFYLKGLCFSPVLRRKNMLFIFPFMF